MAAWLYAVAACCLTWALQLYDGTRPDSTALALVVTALVLTLMGLNDHRPLRRSGLLQWALLAMLLAQLCAHLTVSPGKHLDLARGGFRSFNLAILAVAMAATVTVTRPQWNRRTGSIVLLMALAVGLWFLRKGGQPEIDVHEFQQQGCAALARMANPYNLTFRNLYPDNTPFYAPGLAVHGRLQFGFIYPPLSLYLAMPGWLLTGDHRYGQWLALVLAGALVMRARPAPVAVLAVALLLFAPRSLFIVEQAWTEPFVLLGLAAVLYSALRRPQWLPWALGLWLSTKQYMVLVAPLGLLLLPRPWSWCSVWAMTWRALAVVAAVCLPWWLVNPEAFAKSVVWLQILQPFRADSLSLLAAFAQNGQSPLPTWTCFIAAGLALGYALWRAPRTASGLAAGTAAVLLAFLLLNKQAFWNYYFLPLGALWFGVALAGLGAGQAATAVDEATSATGP
ncbi:MAG: hypothetical protein EXR77_15485 [Myxococcales bacterium]|nr:hypothetical protein [Myxococcales bacterium]